jgi:nicotinamidase-related amidase
MAKVKRIVPDQCCGAIIDVQPFFLAQLDKPLQSRIKANTANLVRLLDHFHIPIVVTLEQPVGRKGTLPREIGRRLGNSAQTFEKEFYDLTKEKPIRDHLRRLKKKQVIVAGCETDVCVLQSCLGLRGLGHDVFLVEETLFSSSRDIDAAVARLEAAGAVFVTYKMLYYELMASVDSDRPGDKGRGTFDPMPDDLPDTAEA